MAQSKDYKNLRDSYKLYKKTVENPIDIKNYLKIVADYNKFLIEKVLEGEAVMFPEKLGTLSIVGRKQKIKLDEDGNPKGLPPNWRKTKELWDSNAKAKEEKKLVYCLNEHTDGVRYKYIWQKRRMLIKNKNLYSFKLTRANKRTLHKKILGGMQYITT